MVPASAGSGPGRRTGCRPGPGAGIMVVMRRLGVVLLSGGLDSTTVAAGAKARGLEMVALTFDYGQRHRLEIESAGKVAALLGLPHEVVPLPAMARLSWYSALTSGVLDVPRGRPVEDLATGVPATYVPMRNTVFLTLAAALLESRVLGLIEPGEAGSMQVSASIFIAANDVDYSGYPDCRPGYFAAMRQALFEGSKLGRHCGVPLEIETPLIGLSKARIVRLGLELGAPLEHTWSCYQDGPVPCGACDACVLRARGFAQAGMEDPLLARLRREGQIA